MDAQLGIELGRLAVRHALFAIELCLRMTPDSLLRDALADCVRLAAPRMNLHGKWQQYTRAATLLYDNVNLAERGCWDYDDDDARALEEYDWWSSEVTARQCVRAEPSGGADPYRGEPRYMTFTMALLLANGSPSDTTLRRVCAIPEANYWRRATFSRLLRGLGHVSFASVKSDTLYLIPRDEGWGLTGLDLSQPKFEYLRPVI